MDEPLITLKPNFKIGLFEWQFIERCKKEKKNH